MDNKAHKESAMGTKTFKPTKIQIDWLAAHGLTFSEREVSAHISVNNPKEQWEWFHATFTNDGKISLSGMYSPEFVNGDHVDRFTTVCHASNAKNAVEYLLSERI